MRIFHAIMIGVLIATTGLVLQGQGTPGTTAKGMPPRATAGDYLSQTKAGNVTIAAEFTGHSIPTMEGTLTNEEYVAVETALFGPADAKLVLSANDFSLRLNGKKTPLPSQPYVVTLQSLRDPEWAPPESESPEKSKTKMSGSGQPGEPSGPPPPVKIPIEVQRSMAKRVQQAVLPEGERPLPQAGMLFFKHRGKTENLQSVELLYEGPAGTAVLKLQ